MSSDAGSKEENNFTVQCSSEARVVAHQLMSPAKRDLTNAVNSDPALPGDVEALKDIPFTTMLPHKAKRVTRRQCARLTCFILRVSSGEVSEHEPAQLYA